MKKNERAPNQSDRLQILQETITNKFTLICFKISMKLIIFQEKRRDQD